MSAPSGTPDPGVATLRYRPRRLSIWASTAAAAIVLAGIGLWIGLGAEVRRLFTAPQIGTLVGLIVVAIVLLLSLGFSEVRADDTGLRWRNGLRSHRLDWSEVAGIRFRPGDPWAYALTAGPHPDDPVRRPLMGIQATDRALAVARAEELRALWAARRRG